MKPEIEKLIKYLHSKNGIQFIEKEGSLPNVTFKKDDKIVRIANVIFYRQSGLICTHKDLGEHKVEVILVTDDMFYNVFMKAILEKHFEK